MFILHSSNKTENLVEHLAAVIKSAPLSSPFAKEVFLIQSQGMERWLSQQLASRFPVWANYQFLFPGHFFSHIAQQLDSNLHTETFNREQLLWRFEALLRHLNHPDLQPIRHYLSGSNLALKRFQLAQQLAQLFDQYQLMRPDLLANWQQGKLTYGTETERWQRTLWQQLAAQIQSPTRTELWLQVIKKLNQIETDSFKKKLPARVSIFGINSMPPLFLSYLQALARHSQVHLYLLNPAQSYWADLASKQQITQDEDSLNGHPLLASLGQQGREFQSLLLDVAQFDVEPQSFETIENPNNLQQLQNDLLANALTGQNLTRDNSISIHACHSRKREVEVLKDQLLHSLESDPNLELRDCVVMAPDIQQYEPFISAIFHDIQHAIADRNLRLDNRALDSFIRFLELSQSRLGWQSVVDLLERHEIYASFGLHENDLELIKFWIEDTQVRWGQSAKHKQELGLPPLSENTWQAALDRLLMGYAVGQEDGVVLDILPYRNIEGTSASALGGLHDFLHLLFAAKSEFKSALTLKKWGLRLDYYANQLLVSADFLERQQLNEILSELSSNLAEFHHDEIELPVLLHWLETMVAERKSANGFLRGQLTFCSMLPMRSIPFKLIALLGINEGEFPKLDRKPTFDLIAQNYRLGDRSRRADDRYQFLEILLSVRQQLIISYVGQSQSSNDKIPPSVVISELVEVLQQFYQLDNLITYHPLQPFSPRYFDGTSSLFSYSEGDCNIAKAFVTPKPEPVAWWQGEIKNETTEEAKNIIELSDLFYFFQHPQRYFLRRQIQLQLTGIETETEERERFTLNPLESYSLRHDWLEQLLNDKEVTLQKTLAQGLWLSGSMGEVTFQTQTTELEEFVERIHKTGVGKPIDDLSVDFSVGAYRLIGKLNNRFQNGSLIYRFAKLKGKDFIFAWLHHLLTNQITTAQTLLLTAEHDFHFSPLQKFDNELLTLLNLYQIGKQRPDAFFTEAAIAYCEQAVKLKTSSRANKPAIEEAKKHLCDSISKDTYISQVFGDLLYPGELLTDDFAQLCENVFLPAWESAHE